MDIVERLRTQADNWRKTKATLSHHALQPLAEDDASDEIEKLRGCAGRVIAAFESLGTAKWVAEHMQARQECEGSMLALKAILTPNVKSSAYLTECFPSCRLYKKPVSL